MLGFRLERGLGRRQARLAVGVPADGGGDGTDLEARERAEVARHSRVLIDGSGLGGRDFASRIGVSPEPLGSYLDASTSPTSALMPRMGRLSDRFVKVKSARSAASNCAV